jgi:hypothetical protein
MLSSASVIGQRSLSVAQVPGAPARSGSRRVGALPLVPQPQNAIGNPLMRFKVRNAAIPKELRDHFERYGETIIATALATAPRPPLLGLDGHEEEALKWLTERSDGRERKETRIELLEWGILIFVVLGVLVESGLAA